jgi:uncharacterized membrane protein (DUF106 family)
MKFKAPKIDTLLKDKNVLYIVLALAVLNLLGYLVVRNTEAVIFFLIVGFLATYFSKNMIVVLLIAMLTTNLFVASKKTTINYYNSKEGMKEGRKEVKQEIQTKISEKKANDQAASDASEETEVVEEVTTISNNKKNRIDYAKNLEEAYKNLEKSVGKNGVKGLTDQTQTLLKQQNELMQNIKTIEPFLEKASGFLETFNMDSLTGILNGGNKKQ